MPRLSYFQDLFNSEVERITEKLVDKIKETGKGYIGMTIEPLREVIGKEIESFKECLREDSSAPFVNFIDETMGSMIAQGVPLIELQNILIISRSVMLELVEEVSASDSKEGIASIRFTDDIINKAFVKINQLYQKQFDEKTKETEEKAERLASLYEISTSILQSYSEAEKTIQLILRSLEKAGYDKTMLSLVEGDFVVAKYAVGEGMEKIVEETRRAIDGPDILAEVARTGEVMVIEDSRVSGRCDQEAIKKSGIITQIILPLKAREEVIGTLQVASMELRRVSLEEVQLLETFASQAAVAIENARLFENTQRQLEELTSLRDSLEKQVIERTKELQRASEERDRLQQEMIEAQKRALRELSTPIVPITNNLIVMPLIGTIDTARSQQIMENLLQGISQYQAQVVIIDITGVPMVDTGVANHLLQSARAAGLLGSQVVLVGISPEVAQTIIQLGVDLTGIVTRSDLQSGVEYALEQLGMKISPSRDSS